MRCAIDRKSVAGKQMEGHISFPMLTAEHGCVRGFCSGITFYTTTEYPTPGVHDDQEGFVVMEGSGWAKVGDEEFRIGPDMCFVAPAGIKHAIKKDKDVPHVKVCWFHGAV